MPEKKSKDINSTARTSENDKGDETTRFKSIFFRGVQYYLAILIALVIMSFAAIFFDSINEIALGKYQGFFAGMLLLAGSIIALWQVPKLQIARLIELGKFPERSRASRQARFDRERDIIKTRDDLRKTTAQVIGGLFFALSLAATFYSYQLTKDRLFFERHIGATQMIFRKESDQFARINSLHELSNIAHESTSSRLSVLVTLIDFLKARSSKLRENGGCTVAKDDSIEDVWEASKILGNKDLKFSSISQIDLTGVILNKANLKSSRFGAAIFTGSCLLEADFTKAILPAADFTDANVSGAIFDGADLRGANLSQVLGLNETQIMNAIIDEQTKVPGDLTPAKNKRFNDLKGAKNGAPNFTL